MASNLDEKSKDIIKQDLEKEYNEASTSKEKALSDYTNKKGFTEGDNIRTFLVKKRWERAVKEHNKKAKLFKKYVNFSIDDKEAIADFVSNTDRPKTLKIKSGQEIDLADANVINAIFNNNSSGAFEHNTIYSNDNDLSDSGKTVALHEYTHAALEKFGFSEKDFQKIHDSFKVLLNDKFNNI